MACHIFSEHTREFFAGSGQFGIDQSDGALLSHAVIWRGTRRGNVSHVPIVASEDGSISCSQLNRRSRSEFWYFDEASSQEVNNMSHQGR
jgi:hypothetical protein